MTVNGSLKITCQYAFNIFSLCLSTEYEYEACPQSNIIFLAEQLLEYYAFIHSKSLISALEDIKTTFRRLKIVTIFDSSQNVTQQLL